MPLYEYHCEVCESRFELRRTTADSAAPATCPAGHGQVRRLLSVFATAGRSGSGPAPMSIPGGGGGGGCCGGGCGCAR